jgi:hypothetical protein
MNKEQIEILKERLKEHRTVKVVLFSWDEMVERAKKYRWEVYAEDSIHCRAHYTYSMGEQFAEKGHVVELSGGDTFFRDNTTRGHWSISTDMIKGFPDSQTVLIKKGKELLKTIKM